MPEQPKQTLGLSPESSSLSSLVREIEQVLGGITPGDWIVRKELRQWDECVHYMIQTAEKLPEHPHSQRFIAWMCGSLGETTLSHWRERQKQGMGWRDDPAIEADARLMAAAPRLLRSVVGVLRQQEEDEKTEKPKPCKVCGGYGFVAQKQCIDDGYGEVDSCPSCGDAPAAPASPSGWQPIETAPKDGTWIVGYGYPKHAKGGGYAPRACLTRWWDQAEAPAYCVGWSYQAPGYTDAFEPTLWIPAPQTGEQP